MKRLRMKNIVSDDRGEIFITNRGQLRLVLDKPSEQKGTATWIRGRRRTPLVRIPLDSIQKVETTTHDIDDKDGLLSAVLAGNQNVILHLRGPATASGLYGTQKRFQRLSLTVDDVQSFVEAVSGR